jgi:HEAT repeat protein
MSKQFNQLLVQLLDDDLPIPSHLLSELSDLDREKTEELRARWPSIPVHKRRLLMEELGRIAEENVLLIFEAVNRIGLEDEDAAVKRTAIDNLWECEDPALITPLIGFLRHDSTSEVRAAAAKGLGSFVLLAEIESLPDQIRLEIEDALLQSLHQAEDESIYCNCLESLGYSSRSEVQELIHQAFQSKEEKLVKSALLAMGRSANNQWEEQVLSCLYHPSPQIRSEAAAAAGELEIHAAVHDLIDLLEDVNQEVRHAALWSLSQLGGIPATEAIISYADDVEEDEEGHFLEDVLDNVTFINGTRDLLIFDFDDPEDTIS